MLFSDIEQSTVLLTRLGRRYEEALDGCRIAQRAAWAAFRGVEIGTEGDSFFVAFSTAEEAVAAAVEAQRSLTARDWPDGEQVRVRMGIHTGNPRIHDDGYVGIDVHRAARIAAAAHGGQVVISDATAKLVGQALPAHVGVRDLGGHRLKDLNQAEHLYQVLIPGARADFPPLKAVGTTSSLPAATTPLVGRRNEVAELVTLLADREVRLVTLTGPGGSGKTRLAVAAAQEVVQRYPDGVYFVPLAAVTGAESICSSIGEGLDLPIGRRIPPALYAELTGRRMLLVLDNLEQIEGAGAVVGTLLRGAPDLVVLATSRRPLHLTSEHQYAVPPLPLPVTGTLEAAEASAAVQLFLDRAQAVRASFALTRDNFSDVAALCGHLDGLPLAIELAAARTKVWSPRALLTRLGHALDLRGSHADRPTRQQALRDTIDWSYRLLPEPQRTLFRRLGAFVGTDLDGLAAICADIAVPDEDPVELVADLVDASLVTVTEDDDGEPRFGMLETIRAFALDALADAGELEDARRMHAAHFASVAARLHWRSVWAASHQHAIRGKRLFALELDNFRAALAWATTVTPTGGRTSSGIGTRSAVGLALLAGAGRIWLEATLEATQGAETAELGTCLYAYAEVLMAQRDLAAALVAAQRSVAILRAHADIDLPLAVLWVGNIEAQLGNTQVGRRAYEEAADLARQSGDELVLGRALHRLSVLEWEGEHWEAVLRLLQESRQAMESVGSDYYTAVADHDTACVLRKLGRIEEAHELMSLVLRDEARTAPPLDLVGVVEDYAAVLADGGYAQLAPLLLAACDAEHQRMGTGRDQWQEREVSDARSASQLALSASEWNDAYARGRSMTVQDALDEALAATTVLRI